MSKEIKFRVWSFFDKAFHYFDIYEGCPHGIYGGLSEPMQFTGLKDKNNKEIYEGDIISIHHKIKGEYRNAEIIWSNSYLTWLAKTWYENEYFSDNLYSINLDCHKEFFEIKLIGNIFETPELLKK